MIAAEEISAYPPVLSPEQREQYKRRIQTKLNWKDPAIQSISDQRFEKVWAEDQELHRMWPRQPREAVIRQRTTEVDVSLDPHALWLCGHHIEQARDVLRYMDNTVNAPMDRRSREFYGNGQHRVKVMRSLPDQLRSRLAPVFSQADLWDSGGLFEARFNEWVADYEATLPERSRQNRFPEAFEAYQTHRGCLVGLLDEMLALFTQPQVEDG
ncbi:hypothetical protein [Halochromatium salexigens]|uniref:Uncharacterized protein n=1 Tax=Halochromatium salexigens TaxID=49447 RepID=A0AAJ0UCN2_HALSE|nr:hypothetical protein [Halochromatium salexigens]MBK5929096.1 hypothetical protein [Halochromatium salexigens]